MSSENKNTDDNNKKGNDKRLLLLLAIAALVFTVSLNYIIGRKSMSDVSEVKYSEFIEMLDEGRVEEVEFNNSIINFTLKEDEEGSSA